MTDHAPNLDAITAYLDGALSEDAARSLGQHLARCDLCATALEREKQFLGALDDVRRVEPPSDFVEGVMARVAQQPAYRPATPVPWRLAVGWSLALGVMLALVVAVGAWAVFQSGMLESADSGGVLAYGITRLANFTTEVLKGAQDLVAPAFAVAKAIGEIFLRLASLAATSGWVVQVGLLLLTVMLNYAFTRLVADYQRRTER